MTIEQYIKRYDMTYEEFADIVGCSVSAITLWVQGKRTPRPSMAQNIVIATDGEVTLEDLYMTER